MWQVNNEGFVRTLTLDRPEAMNSLSPSIIDELIEHLEATAIDDSVRVLLITGKGKIFSSGMNVNALKDQDAPEHVRMFNYSVPKMFNTFIDFPKPLIMAVNGLGVGFGATVLGHADIVIMAESAKLKCPFASLGNVPEACATEIFPRLMGHQQAFWFLLSDEWVTAQQCKEMGLALDVVADDQLMAEAMRRAQTLSAFPTVVLTESKALIKAPYRQAMRRANNDEMDVFNDQLKHAACKEGLAAFLEKRPADFSTF